MAADDDVVKHREFFVCFNRGMAAWVPLRTPNGDPVPERVRASLEQSRNPQVGERYREALSKSYWDGMMNYYRANYADMIADVNPDTLPDITCPVLQFHGLKDTAVDKDGLNGTWNWITQDYTLVTTPAAGHFIQWEARDLVSQTMKSWLLARCQPAGR